MREIRTKTSSAVGPADRVAVHARGCFEDMPAREFFVILFRRLLLLAHPGVEVFWRIHIHAQKHLRVLSAAVLRALAEKQARLVGIDPRFVWVIWNQVCLSCKLWYPETVIRISGKQFQECRGRMSSVAHGNMEFVGGDDTKRWISKFPPKLMPDGCNLQSPRGPRCVLDRVNYAGSSGEQHCNDQNWDHGPGQFNLCTSIHLSWFAPTVSRLTAEFDNRENQQCKDHRKNQARDGKYEKRQVTNRLRGGGAWVKDAGNGVRLGFTGRA